MMDEKAPEKHDDLKIAIEGLTQTLQSRCGPPPIESLSSGDLYPGMSQHEIMAKVLSKLDELGEAVNGIRRVLYEHFGRWE